MGFNVKRELILEDIRTELEGITIANGFNTDVGSVTRDPVLYDEIAASDMPCLVILSGVERAAGEPSARYKNKFEVVIACYIDHIHPNLLATQVENFIGDIKKKLHEQYTRGGNAISTHYTEVRVAVGLPEPRGGFEIDVQITYQATTTAP